MQRSKTTLNEVADRPERFERPLALNSGAQACWRPLIPEDSGRLAEFLRSLSPETRDFWTLPAYDESVAKAICEAIGKYDKLRMIAIDEPLNERGEEGKDSKILALYEIAFHLGSDAVRYECYGIDLKPAETCRFGPCIRDDCQGAGLGSLMMPHLIELLSGFEMKTVILWGGVLQRNHRAIRFYLKHGFRHAGSFFEPEGESCHDMWRPLAL